MADLAKLFERCWWFDDDYKRPSIEDVRKGEYFFPYRPDTVDFSPDNPHFSYTKIIEAPDFRLRPPDTIGEVLYFDNKEQKWYGATNDYLDGAVQDLLVFVGQQQSSSSKTTITYGQIRSALFSIMPVESDVPEFTMSIKESDQIDHIILREYFKKIPARKPVFAALFQHEIRLPFSIMVVRHRSLFSHT